MQHAHEILKWNLQTIAFNTSTTIVEPIVANVTIDPLISIYATSMAGSTEVNVVWLDVNALFVLPLQPTP